MTEKKLLVKTTLGNTILDLESRVDVYLNKDMYLQKQALDLNPNDVVLYKNEYIEAPLKKVDGILDGSPRYLHAKNKVLEKNSENKYIPVLRTELWRGILKGKGAYHESLESIIRKENEEDFTATEYDEATEFIYNLVNKEGLERRIKNWLRGNIYAPQDWSIFHRLARINPMFKEFDKDYTGLDGRYYNYKLFVTTRRVIMSTLAKRTGRKFKAASIESELESEGRWRLRLGNEIDLVVKTLLGDKETEYSPARILDIEELKPRHRLNREVRKDSHHKLSRGILTSKDGLYVNRKDVIEFLQDYFLVNALFSNIVDKYIDIKYNRNFEPFILKINSLESEGKKEEKEERKTLLTRFFAPIISFLKKKKIVKEGKESGRKGKRYIEGIKHLLLEKYNNSEGYKTSSTYARLQDLLGFDEEKVEYADKVTDLLVKDVFNGRFDRYFNFPQDSFKKLLESEYKIRSVRPRIFIEQERALDNYENCLKKINECLEKGYEKDSLEFKAAMNRAREAHDTLLDKEKRMERRFPVKCDRIYHGSVMLTYLKDKGEEKKEVDIEKLIKDYDLEPFRAYIEKGHFC